MPKKQYVDFYPRELTLVQSNRMYTKLVNVIHWCYIICPEVNSMYQKSKEDLNVNKSDLSDTNNDRKLCSDHSMNEKAEKDDTRDLVPAD